MHIKLILFTASLGLTIHLQASRNNTEVSYDIRNRQIAVIQKHIEHLIALEASNRSDLLLLQNQARQRMEKECLQSHRVALCNACGLKLRFASQPQKQQSNNTKLSQLFVSFRIPEDIAQ